MYRSCDPGCSSVLSAENSISFQLTNVVPMSFHVSSYNHSSETYSVIVSVLAWMRNSLMIIASYLVENSICQNASELVHASSTTEVSVVFCIVCEEGMLVFVTVFAVIPCIFSSILMSFCSIMLNISAVFSVILAVIWIVSIRERTACMLVINDAVGCFCIRRWSARSITSDSLLVNAKLLLTINSDRTTILKSIFFMWTKE